MKQFQVLDGRANWDMSRADIVEEFTQASAKKAIKYIKDDYADMDVVLIDSVNTILWSTQWEE
jgi:chromosomal replication initiation ATPase DnaA